MAVFQTCTFPTLGYCSLNLGDDWLTTRWVDQQGGKINITPGFATLYLSGCTVHFWLRSDTSSPRRFSSSAMTMTVAMVMLCMMMVHANVKPQKDFSLQKVGWSFFLFIYFFMFQTTFIRFVKVSLKGEQLFFVCYMTPPTVCWWFYVCAQFAMSRYLTINKINAQANRLLV